MSISAKLVAEEQRRKNNSVRALAELNAAKAEAAHAEAARLVSPAKRDAARRCNLYGYQERGLFPKPHSVPHVQAAAAEMYHVGSSPSALAPPKVTVAEAIETKIAPFRTAHERGWTLGYFNRTGGSSQNPLATSWHEAPRRASPKLSPRPEAALLDPEDWRAGCLGAPENWPDMTIASKANLAARVQDTTRGLRHFTASETLGRPAWSTGSVTTNKDSKRMLGTAPLSVERPLTATGYMRPEELVYDPSTPSPITLARATSSMGRRPATRGGLSASSASLMATRASSRGVPVEEIPHTMDPVTFMAKKMVPTVPDSLTGTFSEKTVAYRAHDFESRNRPPAHRECERCEEKLSVFYKKHDVTSGHEATVMNAGAPRSMATGKQIALSSGATVRFRSAMRQNEVLMKLRERDAEQEHRREMRRSAVQWFMKHRLFTRLDFPRMVQTAKEKVLSVAKSGDVAVVPGEDDDDGEGDSKIDLDKHPVGEVVVNMRRPVILTRAQFVRVMRIFNFDSRDDQKGLNLVFSTYDLESRDRMDFAHFCSAFETVQQNYTRLQLGLQGSGSGGGGASSLDKIDLSLLYKD